MNRLQKFVEKGGLRPGRIAYALGAEKLPAPRDGTEWHAISDFNARRILANANLKDQVAIKDGYALLPTEEGR